MGNSLVYNDGLVLECNEGIILGLWCSEVLSTTLEDADIFKLGDGE